MRTRRYVVSCTLTILFSLILCALPGFNAKAEIEFLAPQTAQQPQQAQLDLSIEDMRRLIMTIANIKHHYIKPTENRMLFENAIRGMLTSLDPHSAFLNADDLQDLELATTGEFVGIGIEITPYKGALKIISPIDDTPAAKAGIKASDLLVKIDNKLVKNMSMRKAISLLRGKRGTKVDLTVFRQDENKTIPLTLIRDTITVKSVTYHMLTPKYGYLRIAIFQKDTSEETKKALIKLSKKAKGKLKGLVLDLRNNPGGILEASVDVADLFLDAKKTKYDDLIIFTKGNEQTPKITAKATDGEIIANLPLVILINEGSASASEIVAGALQDHRRGIVIGTRSFGKGSVQTVLPIDSNSAIKLTTALYFTPSGRSIQATGIVPDVMVPDIQIPKVKASKGKRIGESDLLGHLTSDKADAKKQRAKLHLDLAEKDYPLYQALNILKSLTALST